MTDTPRPRPRHRGPPTTPSPAVIEIEEALLEHRRANCKPGYDGHANRGGRDLICRRCAADFILAERQS